MRNKKHEAEKKGLQLIIDGLEKEKRTLKEEVEDLKLKKKMESEDIKHMIKIDREKKDIEIQKEKVKLQGEQAAAIAEVKDKYRDKVETELQTRIKDMQKMYSEILMRLPNYSVDHKIIQKDGGK